MTACQVELGLGNGPLPSGFLGVLVRLSEGLGQPVVVRPEPAVRPCQVGNEPGERQQQEASNQNDDGPMTVRPLGRPVDDRRPARQDRQVLEISAEDLRPYRPRSRTAAPGPC